MVRRCVCDLENLVKEAAMAHWGLSRQKQTKLLAQVMQSVAEDWRRDNE